MSAIRDYLNEMNAFDCKMFDENGGHQAITELNNLMLMVDAGDAFVEQTVKNLSHVAKEAYALRKALEASNELLRAMNDAKPLDLDKLGKQVAENWKLLEPTK